VRRDFPAALRDRGVAFALAEGFFVVPGRDDSAFAAELDLMCEFGAERINTLCLDADRSRGFDQLGALVEMAAARGLRTTLEFLPASPVGDLATAAAAVRHVGRPQRGLAEAGVGPHERLGRCVTAARELLAGLDA
jgi:hypothetical protein